MEGILEITSAYDAGEDWAEVTDERKQRRYEPLREKMSHLLPPAWQVETLLFTAGVRGFLAEIKGQVSHLDRRGTGFSSGSLPDFACSRRIRRPLWYMGSGYLHLGRNRKPSYLSHVQI
jgi:hypothetical protein